MFYDDLTKNKKISVKSLQNQVALLN